MHTLKNKPRGEIIALLEQTLERAKRGEIFSLAVVYIDDSPHLGGATHWARPRDRLTLVGALEVCADQIKSLLGFRKTP